jgi:hypothetical protein
MILLELANPKEDTEKYAGPTTKLSISRLYDQIIHP